MYAVHIVTFHDFADEAHQVFFGLRMSGIEEILAFIRHADSGFAFGDRSLPRRRHACGCLKEWSPSRRGIPYRVCGIRLRQRQAGRSRGCIGFSCQDGVIRLDGRFVEYIAPRTGLKQYGVEVGGFQFVQYLYEFVLLLADALGRGGAGAGPVQSVDGGDPCGTYLVLGRRWAARGRRQKIYNSIRLDFFMLLSCFR
mgnify:CR=1 FL=1